MDDSDKWQQLQNWKTQLYQIGTAEITNGSPSTDDAQVGAWCALLHQAASQLSSQVHAFYVCLYEPDAPDNKPLHFVYYFDEGSHDSPSRRPMGNGPTSLVVRTGQPYILTPQTRLYQQSGNPFGQLGRQSNSAVHLPLRQWQRGKQAAPLLRGVVSAQSYTTGLWTRRDAPFVLDLQSRADDAAQHWFGLTHSVN